MPRQPEPRTVLLLIETLNRGGIENVLLRLIPVLKNEGWRGVVVTLRGGGEMLVEYRRAGIEVITLNEPYIFSWSMIAAVRQTIAEVDPHIIMTNLVKADIIGRIFLRFMTDRPVVPYLVTTYNHPRYWIARVFEWITKPLATGYIANSDAVQHFYEKRLGVAPGKIVVAPNGVDTDIFTEADGTPVRKEFGLPKDAFVITCVANLAPNKGQADLLDAFDRVLGDNPKAYLLLVGDGEQRHSLTERRLSLRSKDRIKLVGRRTDVPAILKVTDIFALPTLFEGMSTALLEAMAAHKAILTTNIPENKVLLTHNESAILVSPRNVTELAEGLQRLSQDTTLRRRLSDAAYGRVTRDFSIHSMSTTFAAVFTSLCPPLQTNRKKIIHLIGSLESGGAENMLLRTLPLLNEEKDFEHQVITLTRPGELSPEFQKRGIHTSHISVRSLLDIWGLNHLTRIVRDRTPAMVITYLFHASFVGRVVLQRQLKVPIIPFLRSTYNYPRYLPARLFEKVSKGLVDHYFANSEAVRDYYVDHIGVRASKITIIHNGIDVSVYDRASGDHILADVALPHDRFVITCVANLATNKGYKYLLEAFELFASNKERAYLLIVGEGSERAALESQIASYNTQNRIIFMGRRSDVPDILATTDVFVLPTLFEGLSNAILEAMAAGCAIVTTDIPESRVVIRHEETGLLVPTEDSATIATAIGRLYDDRSLSKKLGNNARLEVKSRFDLRVIARDWNQRLKSFVR